MSAGVKKSLKPGDATKPPTASSPSRRPAHGRIEDDLRRERDYAQSIVDTVREPMLVLNQELRIESANRSFCETFRLAPHAVAGHFLYEIGNGEWNIPALRQLLEQILPENHQFQDFEVKHDFSALGPRVMLLNARRVRSAANNSPFVLLALEDVTERKRIQEELLRSNEDLQRFSYVAAHDLRSPAHGALRALQQLTRRVEAKWGEEERSLLLESVNSLQRLSALMQDLLTFADAGNAPQQHQLIPLQEPFDLALANLQHHLAAAQGTVVVSALPVLRSDCTQLAMVFQNLIGNAIKYRSEASLRIQIEAQEQGSFWQFSVIDNGQGFDPRFAASIFEPFKRLQGTAVPGSGIGLATCKRVIERLGGRIWADSAPGQGSRFCFTLPGES